MSARAADHLVQFYEREEYLHGAVARFLSEGLLVGEPLVVIASRRSEQAVRERLGAQGHDLDRAVGTGQLTLLDARETLGQLMLGAAPDRARFRSVVGGAIDRAAGGRRVRAYGEMVDLLWQDGEPQAALELEGLWNELARARPLRLLCACAMASFHREGHGAQFRRVCEAHTHVIPAEPWCEGEPAESSRRQIAMLQQRARALESEVAHRKEVEGALRVALADLRRSDDALREGDRRKDEFLAMLGHELRNPLAPILTGLEVLRLRGDGGEGVAVIERQVRHLVRLVDDLLDVSRITRGEIRLAREPLDLGAVLARAVEIARPLFEQRSHALAVEVPSAAMSVHGDAVRLAQVFANLLTNAAKYTEPGGTIRLRAARDGGQIAVTVEDSGVGIAPEVLPHVFDLFVQGERTLDRSQGGLGVGLTVARSLVELHGGTIRVHSEGAGTGSEIVVRLPALDVPAPAGVASERPRANGGRPPLRVLLVDDNADAVDVLAEALRGLGHEVAVAHDGPQALALAARFRPEVALLDIGLPVMDGYELASRLRAPPRGRGLRLVALTGYGQDGDRARSRAAGFDVHLVKPVDLDAVVAALAEPRAMLGS